MSAPVRLAAVVVAGGSARRMGSVDKLALEVGGRSLLDRVLAAARPLCNPVVVVGPRRATAVEGVVFTTEAAPGGGPVPAVAAGLAALDHDAGVAVAVLAGDLALLASAHLEALSATLSDPAVDAAAAVDERGRPHPLLAVHRGPALGARVHGLGPELAGLPAAQLLPPGVVAVTLDPEATLNVNRPADLERARALLGARP
ncbi:MAG TPA: NTP transferase domain-containing protein [Acidimicrobiales bacterium]|jgi:molybdopterin-guanine dinucleotide biosynthesis protein A|nr:NTP transferase domain-containing protein [Acidimicrobiales bacterium]